MYMWFKRYINKIKNILKIAKMLVNTQFSGQSSGGNGGWVPLRANASKKQFRLRRIACP